MDINIIADFLKEYDVKLVLAPTASTDVELVFGGNSGHVQNCANCLRVVTVKELCADFDSFRGQPLLVLGNIAAPLLALLDSHVLMVCKEAVQLEQILDCLYELQQFYSSWNERLLMAILEKKSIHDLFEIGAEVFDNPIFLENMESQLLAEHGLDSVSLKDDFLHQLYTKGYVDTADFIKYSSLREENNLFSSPDLSPTFLDTIQRNNRLLVTYIPHHGQRFAAFQIVEDEHPITAGDAAYAKVFSEGLKLYFETLFPDDMNSNRESVILQQIIGGNFVSGQMLQELLEHLAWERNGSFLVVAMTWADPQYCTPYTKQRLTFDLRDCFLNSAVCSVNNYFYLFVNCEAGFEEEVFWTQLEKVSDRNCLLSGVSQRYYDFSETARYCRESEYALNMHGRLQGDCGNILSYEACLAEVLGEFLSAAQGDQGSLILPLIDAIDCFGETANDHAVKTLFTYISSGFNSTVTASKLSIHRNTLAYRLEKIKSLIGTDLAKDGLSDETAMLYLISCYLSMWRSKLL